MTLTIKQGRHKKPKARKRKPRKMITAWAFTYRYPNGCVANEPSSGVVCRDKYLYYDGILDAMRRWYRSALDHGCAVEFGPITRITLPAPAGRWKTKHG